VFNAEGVTDTTVDAVARSANVTAPPVIETPLMLGVRVKPPPKVAEPITADMPVIVPDTGQTNVTLPFAVPLAKSTISP
jgi:hypothetical protein